MPTSEQILSGLTEITNQWSILALLWHVYFAVFAIALVLGVRPLKRTIGVLLALPLFSVSALAWTSANPFNGTVFALAGLALVAISTKLPREQISIAPTWMVGSGVIMFLFGWVYPHFLATTSFVPYLYSAPTGLIPCPTLSIIIGLGLIVAGLDSRAWSLVLGATGIFYGLFGAVRLGVTIDLVLLLGALLIVLAPFIGKSHVQKHAAVTS
jgi:hypothetical protein